MLEWLMSQDATWLLMIFPILVGAIVGGAINQRREWKAKVRDPYTMTNEEYEQHNQRRFSA